MSKEKISKKAPVKAKAPDESLNEYASTLANLKHQIQEARANRQRICLFREMPF
jgi:hypothetical protein